MPLKQKMCKLFIQHFQEMHLIPLNTMAPYLLHAIPGGHYSWFHSHFYNSRKRGGCTLMYYYWKEVSPCCMLTQPPKVRTGSALCPHICNTGQVTGSQSANEAEPVKSKLPWMADQTQQLCRGHVTWKISVFKHENQRPCKILTWYKV